VCIQSPGVVGHYGWWRFSPSNRGSQGVTVGHFGRWSRIEQCGSGAIYENGTVRHGKVKEHIGIVEHVGIQPGVSRR
jgi:hypothetical protein